MVMLCAILTMLQYRWTGELAAAEVERFKVGIDERLKSAADYFVIQVATHCDRLHPEHEEVERLGITEAHLARIRKWNAAQRPIVFKRAVLALPEEGGLAPHFLDLARATVARGEWPPGWEELRNILSNRLSHEIRQHHVTPDGMRVLLQIHGPTPQDGRPQAGWLILELHEEWLRDVILPEIVRIHIRPEEGIATEVRVVQEASSPKVIFSSATEAIPHPPLATLRFHAPSQPDGTPSKSAPGGRWTLEYRQRPGAFEELIAKARLRNFFVTAALNALILAACIALLRHTRRSRELAGAQMDFVANVSHELRTPLTVIRGAAHNLQHGVVGEPGQVREYARLIAGHATQLGSMVEQVLEFASARRKRGGENFTKLDTAAVLRAAVQATAEETTAANCEVALDIPDTLPAVNGDSAALTRAVQNLISNAARHGGSGGWIGVSAAVAQDEPPAVEIRVADRGPGVPEDEREKIFQPFERGAQAQTGQVRGSGIGLSLVREIVAAHGGKVSVGTRPEGGAIFTIRIPTA